MAIGRMLLGAGAVLAGLAAGAARALDLPASPEPLPRLERIDPLSVTVSGLSSGGFFAHQFHVAHASLVTGAGIMAGGPYACAEAVPGPFWPFDGLDARTRAAVRGCTRYVPDLFGGFLDPPRTDRALAALRASAAAGLVDDPAAVRGHRVWLFRGRDDTVVPLAVMRSLQDLYLQLGVPPGAIDGDIDRAGASHGIPAEGPTGVACDRHASPFVIRCGFDAARSLLQHLYGGSLAPPGRPPEELGRLIAFDQRLFAGADPRVSMLDRGYAYIPRACAEEPGTGGRDCRLHVAFHGCNQSAAKVGLDLMVGAGYVRWAAENRIVLLFPQVGPWSAVGVLGNPQGCWDFWGYSGADYRTRNAPQIRAVRAMIDAVLPAGNRP